MMFRLQCSLNAKNCDWIWVFVVDYLSNIWIHKYNPVYESPRDHNERFSNETEKFPASRLWVYSLQRFQYISIQLQQNEFINAIQYSITSTCYGCHTSKLILFVSTCYAYVRTSALIDVVCELISGLSGTKIIRIFSTWYTCWYWGSSNYRCTKLKSINSE